MNDILSIRNLRAGYRGKVVVDGVSFGVEPGRITTLIGPNGAGKSTVLKTAAGQIASYGGSLLLEGREVGSRTAEEEARIRSVMMTQQMPSEQMTCREVVSVGRTPFVGRLGILSEPDHAAVREAMELVGTAELAEESFREISDGQRQRVLLARAIVQEPRLMILDEPTSFLDIRHKLVFLDLLRKLSEERKIGILMSLHELEFAHLISDEVVCIGADGTVRMAGEPQNIMKDSVLCGLYGVEEGRIADLYDGFANVLKEGNGR